MFKHVLVAIDFSSAWPMLRQRLQALRAWGAEEVTLIYVLSSRYPATPEESHRSHYEKRLSEEAAALEAEDFRVNWQVRVGEPGGEVVAAAQDVGANLVLLGDRGYSRLREFFVGSTALDAARLTTCPLWLEPVKDDRREGADVVLLATDGSNAAKSAERLFQELRANFSRAVAAMATCASEGCDREIADAKAHLQQLDQSDDGMAVRVLDGDPRQVIPALAEELPADLVIIGKRGRNVMQQLLLGSTAEAVCRKARCAVLVVPQAD
ncbi:MAG: universal stress protein [Ectothiorhodospiraceae bacterium]|nr:universal stress protein [Ectothiorhodospiraceae bacterium]MCH8503352.1 universal stress protein [Ectothiorhodospiraceae bacterium]